MGRRCDTEAAVVHTTVRRVGLGQKRRAYIDLKLVNNFTQG